MAANQIPDEIISEILSPLLKHSDEVFSDPMEKPFVAPGYSTSSYLLVSKSWLRVSTPLLYSVVILRTIAQAQALANVFESNKELGLFVRKLRVEAGFGKAMHTILQYSPKITDLCFSLVIWGSDDITGLCRGLPLINPHRVILIDNVEKLKKNKKVEALLDTLVRLIPKWDNLLTFYLPHYAWFEPIPCGRAQRIVSALSKSNSLRNLDVRAENIFPKYLREMTQAPSLKCICLIRLPYPPGISTVQVAKDRILVQVAADPKLKAIVKIRDVERISQLDRNNNVYDADDSNKEFTESADDATQSPAPPPSFVINMSELEKLGKMWGPTIESLEMLNSGKKEPPPSKTSTGFSALPRLQMLRIEEGSPSVFELFSTLSLDALEVVDLLSFGVAGTDAFLQRHGAKLTALSISLEFIPDSKVLDICTRLTVLTVYSHPRKAISEDFFTCAAPHMALAKINFDFSVMERLQRPPLKAALAALDPACFPALNEIEFMGTKWPTSEQEARKSEWVKVSEILRPKGIKLVDMNGVGWTPRLKG